MQAKVVLVARVNDGTGKFPSYSCRTPRHQIAFPIEKKDKAGKVVETYEANKVIGFYVRYQAPTGRKTEPVGKDPIAAYQQYLQIERNFSRIQQGLLPIEEPKIGGDSIAAAIKDFERDKRDAHRKVTTIDSYMNNLRNFLEYCESAGLLYLNQIDRRACLGFVGWLGKNLQKRRFGSQNNTFINNLKDLRVFLKASGMAMPLLPHDWPKEVHAKKEKYSTEAVKSMLSAAATVERHTNNSWSPEDDKDLIHFLMKTGFRDEEIQHAQYSDVNHRTHTINVTSKPKGSFPGLPDLSWEPKDHEPREMDITVDEAFLNRMKARQERYAAKSNSLIFPNSKGKPNAHLIRVIQRLAKEAGIEGRIGLHKFRKMFATMVAREEGIEKARILLGHVDIETTQRYIAADEIAPEASRKAVKKRFADFGD